MRRVGGISWRVIPPNSQEMRSPVELPAMYEKAGCLAQLHTNHENTVPIIRAIVKVSANKTTHSFFNNRLAYKTLIVVEAPIIVHEALIKKHA